jgi:hypothetical protein
MILIPTAGNGAPRLHTCSRGEESPRGSWIAARDGREYSHTPQHVTVIPAVD